MDQPSPPGFLTHFLRFVCLVSVGILVVYAAYWMPRVTHGFAMYYTYSRAVLHGESLAPLYNVDRFNERVASYGMPHIVDMPNNPPTTALAALPICWLSPSTAKVVWTILLLLALGGSLVLLFKIFGISLQSHLGLGLIAFILLFRPVYENIALGQIYLFLLFGFSLSIFGLARNTPRMTASPVSAALLLKGYGIVPLIWFGFTHRWRELIYSVAFLFMAVGFTLPVLGGDSWSEYFSSVVLSLGALPVHGHVAYQTINSFMLHLFTYDSQWLPYPMVELPSAYVRVVSYVVNAGVVAGALYRTSMAPPSLSFSRVVAASVMTAPLAEEHHYVLLLPLVIGLATTFYRRCSVTKRIGAAEIVFLIAALLVALPIPYESLQYAPPPLTLLAYPKLYAGLALLFYSCTSSDNKGAIPCI